MFFLHAMAMAIWFVPLSTVLDAHHLGAIKPYAFATNAVAAFISPLLFGAIADRHLGPTRVLRWLAICTAAAMALATTAIRQQWSPALVLAAIQVHALVSAPTWSLSTSIVLARLAEPRQEFGPVRALATLGWIAGCLLVSALNADASPVAGYTGALVWIGVAGFTRGLPSSDLPIATGEATWRERLGWDTLGLLRIRDHRVVLVTSALFAIPLAAFYPYAPPHLRDLGLTHTSAWMTLGQVTEILAMLWLARLLGAWRLKWVFAAGLAFGVLRYSLCALDGRMWVLLGISLHGLAFTLFQITAQIYIDERVEPSWRSRAQAAMFLMNSGVGNLAGYLGTGAWHALCQSPSGTRWPRFWIGLAAAVALVLAFFLRAYRGRGARPTPSPSNP